METTTRCEVTERLEIIAALLDAIPQTITVRAGYTENWPRCPTVDVNGEDVRFLLIAQRKVTGCWLLTYRWVEGGAR